MFNSSTEDNESKRMRTLTIVSVCTGLVSIAITAISLILQIVTMFGAGPDSVLGVLTMIGSGMSLTVFSVFAQILMIAMLALVVWRGS